MLTPWWLYPECYYSGSLSYLHLFYSNRPGPRGTMLRSQNGRVRKKQLSGFQHFKRLWAAWYWRCSAPCYYSGVHTCNGKLNGPKWHYVHSDDGTDDSEYTRNTIYDIWKPGNAPTIESASKARAFIGWADCFDLNDKDLDKTRCMVLRFSN